MIRTKKLLLVLMGLFAIFALGACGNAENDTTSDETEVSTEKADETTNTEVIGEDKVTVVFGVSGSGQEMVTYVEKALNEKGYKMELVVTDGAIPNDEGILDGSIDINFVQHEAFMNNFNKDRNGDLVRSGDPLYEQYVGLYSSKYEKLEDLPDGAKIAMQNDAANIERALKTLEQAGLIEIDPNLEEGIQASILDITSNPKKLEFVELGGGTLVNALEDVDAAVYRGRAAHEAGFTVEDALFQYEADDLIANAMILATKSGNEDAEWAKIIHEALESQESANLIYEVTGGTWIPYTGE